MGAGSYTIPMSEYYNKANTLKNDVSNVAESLQNNFLQKVSSNISDLDSQDQTFLEGCSAYTSAKSLYTKLKETHGKNLTNMSSFNGQNPLYEIENKDKEFATKFNSIADGTNSEEVTNRLSSLNTEIDSKASENQFTDFLASVSSYLSQEDIQRYMKLAKVNPKKAWETLLNSDSFLAAIQEEPAVEKLFLNLMIKLEKAGNIPKDCMDAIANSEKFATYLSKAPASVQNVVLNTMATVSDKGWKIAQMGEKFVSWVKTVAEFKPIKIATKFLGSKLGQVVTSPWTMTGIKGLISGFNAYTSGGETKGDFTKSAATGIIDAVTSVGPIDGAIMGAQVGGAYGAGAGFIIGTGMWVTQLIWPNWPKNFKNWTNKKIDDAREYGESIKQGIGTITDVLGHVISGKPMENDPLLIKNQMKDAAEKFIDWMPKFEAPKLNWFGG